MVYERALVLRYMYNACLLLNSWKNSLRQSLNHCGDNEFPETEIRVLPVG